MRVRLEDVARAASVSPKTVSRVLNDEANVTDATRQRVRAAMEAMDYRPHPSARSLAGNRSFLVAMLYDNNDNPASTYLADPGWCARGLRRASLQHDGAPAAHARR